jgi:hypothetical protein
MAETKKQTFLDLQKAVNVKKEKGKFVNYSYRNAEQILEVAKEASTNWIITLTDTYDYLPDGRIMLVATAKAEELDGDQVYETQSPGFLDEAPSLTKKDGSVIKQMSDPQWAGAVSSYHRKYALQGLLAIADKDADEAADDAHGAGHTPQGRQKPAATKQPTAPAKAHKKPETDAEKNDAINKTVAAIHNMGFTFEERLGETLDETLDRAVKQFRLAKAATTGGQ